jgi:hypothetical protein
MKNTTSVLRKPSHFSFSRIIHFLFYVSIFGIILGSRLPPVNGPVSFFKKQFLAGHESFFRLQDPGLLYVPFETHLPQSGVASFLTDMPYAPKQKATEQLQAAQGRLAPLLLNPDPVEKTALISCSRNDIALARMQAAGYRPITVLEEGKMIAEKQA